MIIIKIIIILYLLGGVEVGEEVFFLGDRL